MQKWSIKRNLIIGLFSLTLSMAPTMESHAIVWVIIQQVIKKVLKALDIAVQQLQNKTIWLQNAQKALENAMSKLKLDEISDWTEKHRAQYAQYFDELRTVKEIISDYHKVKEIIAAQAQLVDEYKKAIRLFRQDKNFTVEEISYMEKVYAGIMDQSLKNLDQLFLVVNALSTQMTDEKRMEIINQASLHIDQNLDDLRQFNVQNIKLSLQRAKEYNDVDVVKRLYGLE
ncbi:MAG: conjugal transfer protein TraI [Chitinophagaceae bacterium]